MSIDSYVILGAIAVLIVYSYFILRSMKKHRKYFEAYNNRLINISKCATAEEFIAAYKELKTIYPIFFPYWCEQVANRVKQMQKELGEDIDIKKTLPGGFNGMKEIMKILSFLNKLHNELSVSEKLILNTVTDKIAGIRIHEGPFLID